MVLLYQELCDALYILTGGYAAGNTNHSELDKLGANLWDDFVEDFNYTNNKIATWWDSLWDDDVSQVDADLPVENIKNTSSDKVQEATDVVGDWLGDDAEVKRLMMVTL